MVRIVNFALLLIVRRNMIQNRFEIFIYISYIFETNWKYVFLILFLSSQCRIGHNLVEWWMKWMIAPQIFNYRDSTLKFVINRDLKLKRLKHMIKSTSFQLV